MNLTLVIIAAAVATYATRIGGHLVLLRFERLHPRVEAALDAVPAAVLTAIVVPAAARGGAAEIATLVVVALVSTRLAISWVVLLGLATLVALRTALG